MDARRISLAIPDALAFSSLQLGRNPDGTISFCWEPIEALCRANGVEVEVFRNAPEDNVAALITHWYMAHRQAGGDRDATAEDLIYECLAEDALGDGTSHPPGRA